MPTEVRLRKGTYSYSSEIVGTLRNPGSELITGPISVEAICLRNGKAIAEAQGFATPDTARPGATVGFSLTLTAKRCPQILVAGGGYTA